MDRWPGDKAADIFIYWLILAILLILPVLIVPSLYSFTSLAKVAFLRLSAAAIVLAAVWQALRGRLQYRPSRLAAPVAVFTGLLVVSSIASQNPLNSLLGSYSTRFEELPTWLAYFVLFLAGLRYLDDREKIRTAAWFLTAGAGLVSVYAIYQHFGVDWRQASPGLGDRAFAGFENPLNLAGYLAMIIPLVLVLTLSERESKRDIAAGVSALAVIALIFTSTRGAWLAGFIGVLVLFAGIRRRPDAKTHIAVGAAALIILLAVVMAAPAYRARLASSARLEGSAATRISIWRSTAALIGDRPALGWGLDTFREAFPTRRSPAHVALAGPNTLPDRPHNQLLYIAFATGLSGLAAYLWILTRLARASGRLLHSGDLMGAGLAGSLTAYVIQEQFAFSGGSTTPIFWLLAAAACNLAARSDPSLVSNANLRTVSRRLVPALIGVLLAVFLTAPTLAFIGADYAYARGLRQKGSAVLPSLRLAVRLNPWHGQYRETLVYTLIGRYDRGGDQKTANEALALSRQGLRINPLSHDLHFALAEARYVIAKRERSGTRSAEKSVVRALRLQPFHTAALRLRASIYASQDRYGAAAAQMRKVIKLNPDDIEALGELRYLEEQGRKQLR